MKRGRATTTVEERVRSEEMIVVGLGRLVLILVLGIDVGQEKEKEKGLGAAHGQLRGNETIEERIGQGLALDPEIEADMTGDETK
jgi:hypothetical protein